MKQDNQYQGLKIHSPLSESNATYLSQLKTLVDKSIAESTRVIALRFDLRFPKGYAGDQDKVITKFFESFKAQIKAKDARTQKEGKRVYPNRLKYAWVRENNGAKNDHFHVVIIFNKDAFSFLGDFKSAKINTAKRIIKAWGSALSYKEGDSAGSVHFTKTGVYTLDKNDESYDEAYRLLFYRISYFAKNRTKVFGTGKRSFGCSSK
tara:strand:- start:28856 stop:29476 length:621 start_codon:yes stop_codon:yes gene_type:complete